MNAVIPWKHLIVLVEPHYPKAGQGRQPLGLEKMLAPGRDLTRPST